MHRLMDRSVVRWAACLAVLVLVAGVASAQDYKGPYDIVASDDGATLYVLEKDAHSVALVGVADQTVQREITLPKPTTSIALSPNGQTLYVTCATPEGTLCVVDIAGGDVTAEIPVGHSPRGVCISPDGAKAYVCNQFDNDLSVVDLVAKKEIARVECSREPYDAAITPDGKTVFVANHLPIDPANGTDVAGNVTCIDTETLETTNIRLLNGATDLAHIGISPDGKYAVTVSILARFQIPTTQLERGWINTNAMTIIDAQEKRLVNMVLLDDIDLGAANPYGVAFSDDGSQLLVTHAGSHEVSVIDFPAVIEKLLSLPPDKESLKAAGGAYNPNGGYSSVTAEEVPNDLAFLGGMRHRVKLEGIGPRGLVVVDGTAYIPMYFSDTLACLDTKAVSRPKVSEIALGPEPVLTQERQGEIYFHDASLCFQQWLTCVSCHPEARTDALNWDLMNDDMGNPKNVKSMLLSHETPPSMISGIRADAETAVRAGIRHIQFAVRPEEDAQAIDAYLKSLKPVPSPHLVNGELSEAAKRGKEIFESREIDCAYCHPAPLFTDMEMHDVDTRSEYDRRDTWDTPTLVEVWRTAPYLHDGRYTTMKELLKDGDHGGAADKLTDEQMNDLIEYVLSL